MTKGIKISYYTTTVLLSIMMVVSAFMYFYKHHDVAIVFSKLGYPTYIICPLALAKLFGVIAIWVKKSKTLLEWAYAGFFFDFSLAFFAHYMIEDGEQWPALVAMLILLISYLTGKKLN